MSSNLITYSNCLAALTGRFRIRATESEMVLWTELKGRRLRGYKFERRREVDRYVVDFYCSELRMAIDILDPAEPWHGACADADKSIRLRLCGIVYLPLTQEEVVRNLDGVVTRIRQAIRYLPVK